MKGMPLFRLVSHQEDTSCFLTDARVLSYRRSNAPRSGRNSQQLACPWPMLVTTCTIIEPTTCLGKPVGEAVARCVRPSLRDGAQVSSFRAIEKSLEFA